MASVAAQSGFVRNECRRKRAGSAWWQDSGQGGNRREGRPRRTRSCSLLHTPPQHAPRAAEAAQSRDRRLEFSLPCASGDIWSPFAPAYLQSFSGRLSAKSVMLHPTGPLESGTTWRTRADTGSWDEKQAPTLRRWFQVRRVHGFEEGRQSSCMPVGWEGWHGGDTAGRALQLLRGKKERKGEIVSRTRSSSMRKMRKRKLVFVFSSV